jgi:hypothetical protein
MKRSANGLKQLSMTKSKLSPAYGSLAGRYYNPLPEVSLFPQSAYFSLVILVLQRKSHLCIPIKGITRPQSQFPLSSFYERFIYSQDRSTYFPAEADRLWKYINRSHTHECRNWDLGRAIPFLGIFVSNFRCSVFAVCTRGKFSPSLTRIKTWPAVRVSSSRSCWNHDTYEFRFFLKLSYQMIDFTGLTHKVQRVPQFIVYVSAS